MRRIVPLTMVLGFLAPGCGDPDAGKLFADVQYATRCEATLGCGGAKERDICGANQGGTCIAGAESVRASCAVTEGENTRTLQFTATQGSDFSLAVSGATFAYAGGSASGAGCVVTVQDGPNSYRGDCGSANPSATQPCRINNVMFFKNEEGEATIEGNIFCQFLENRANPALQMEVTALGSGPSGISPVDPNTSACSGYPEPKPPACMPARFRLENCSGLEIRE